MKENRVNFTEIRKVIQKRIASEPLAIINKYLRLMESELLKIEDLKLSAFENNKKDQELPNTLKEIYTHLKEHIPPHIEFILGHITAILKESDLTEQDKKFFNGLNKQLVEYKLMAEKRATVDFERFDKSHYRAFQQAFSLCSSLGGVYIRVDQGVDPHLGHIKENDELKECGGICAGLVYKWIENCVKDGENKFPLIGVDSVHKKQTNQLKLDRLCDSRIPYDIQNFEEHFDSLLNTIVDTKPVNIHIQNSTPGSSGHAWGLRKRHDGSYEFFDPNSGYFFFPNQKVFSFWFKEYVHYHQMTKILGFAVNQIVFNFTEKDAKPLEQYFPGINEYTQSVIQMKPKQRGIKITAALHKAVRHINGMIGDNDYQEAELIKIIHSTFANYLEFINSEENLKEVVETLDLLINGSADESKVKGLKNIVDLSQNKAEVKELFTKLKKKYEDKIQILQKNPIKLDEDLAELVEHYKRVNKEIVDEISKLSEAIKQSNASEEEILTNNIKIQYLTNKLYRLDKSNIIKKASASRDQTLDFKYPMEQAKKELEAVIANFDELMNKNLDFVKTNIKNNSNNPEDVIDFLVNLLDNAADFAKKSIKNNENIFSDYLQNENLKRLLLAIDDKKVSLTTLKNDKMTTIDSIKNLFYHPSSSQELKNLSNLLSDPDKFIPEIVSKAQSTEFLKQFLNVKFPDFTSVEMNGLDELFLKESEALTPALKEVKEILCQYINAENKNDISLYGLKTLLCKLFGVSMVDKEASIVDLIKRIDAFYQQKIFILCDTALVFDEYQSIPIFQNRIKATFGLIKSKKGLPPIQFLAQLYKVAPGLANDLLEGKTDPSSCADYFLLGDHTRDNKLNIQLGHQMTENIAVLTKYFNENVRSALIEKQEWTDNDINDFIDSTNKELTQVINNAKDKMFQATTIKEATLCLKQMNIDLQASINSFTNGVATIDFDDTRIDIKTLNDNLCAAIVVHFANQKMRSETESFSGTESYSGTGSSSETEYNTETEAYFGSQSSFETESLSGTESSSETESNSTGSSSETDSSSQRSIESLDKTEPLSLQPLSDIEILRAIKADYENMKKFAKGNAITSFFLPFSYRKFHQGHLPKIESIPSAKKVDLNVLQSQYKTYRDRPSLFRHSAKQVHAENWSAPKSTATAMKAFEAVIKYFETHDWEVDIFSLRIAEITTTQGKKKFVPRNAALIFDLYKQAKESTTTWQDALFRAEKILAENYKRVEVTGDFWGRKSSTQRAYNCAFSIIQENFHAMFFCDDPASVLTSFQNKYKEGNVNDEVSKLIAKALVILSAKENESRKHVIIQTLTDHLYQAISNLPWYRRMFSSYDKDVMLLIAQLTGWNNKSPEEQIKKVKKYMENEAGFFKVRTKVAKEIGIEFAPKDDTEFRV